MSEKRRTHDPLGRLVKHAERFGAAGVFEAAMRPNPAFDPAEPLSVRQLGHLAAQLRRIDSRWRPPHRGLLAVLLERDGAPARVACRQAGCSDSTLSRARDRTEERMPLIDFSEADPVVMGDRDLALRLLAGLRYGDRGMARWLAVDVGLAPNPVGAYDPARGLPVGDAPRHPR